MQYAMSLCVFEKNKCLKIFFKHFYILRKRGSLGRALQVPEFFKNRPQFPPEFTDKTYSGSSTSVKIGSFAAVGCHYML
jgi:hypothetical protein